MTEESQIQKQIAKKHNLTIAEVTLANRSIFEFVAFIIQNGERKPVRLPKVGLFSCSARRVEELAKRNLL